MFANQGNNALFLTWALCISIVVIALAANEFYKLFFAGLDASRNNQKGGRFQPRQSAPVSCENKLLSAQEALAALTDREGQARLKLEEEERSLFTQLTSRTTSEICKLSKEGSQTALQLWSNRQSRSFQHRFPKSERDESALAKRDDWITLPTDALALDITDHPDVDESLLEDQRTVLQILRKDFVPSGYKVILADIFIEDGLLTVRCIYLNWGPLDRLLYLNPEKYYGCGMP